MILKPEGASEILGGLAENWISGLHPRVLIHSVWDPKTDMSDMFTDDADAVCGSGEHTVETTVTGDTGLGSERCCWGRGKS